MHIPPLHLANACIVTVGIRCCIVTCHAARHDSFPFPLCGIRTKVTVKNNKTSSVFTKMFLHFSRMWCWHAALESMKKKRTCSMDEAWAWKLPKTWRFKSSHVQPLNNLSNEMPMPLWINPPKLFNQPIQQSTNSSVYWHHFHAYCTSNITVDLNVSSFNAR